MSINKWRTVRYTYDGCSIYQCLMCYKKWEARTEPGYFLWYTEKGLVDSPVYQSDFKYCPYCKTEWENQQVGYLHIDNEYGLGRKRFEIKEQIRKYYYNKGYDNKKLYWLIEYRFKSSFKEFWRESEKYWKEYDFFIYNNDSRKMVLDRLKQSKITNPKSEFRVKLIYR